MKTLKYSIIPLLLIATIMVAVGTKLDAQQTPSLPTKPPVLKLNDPLPANLFTELAKAINPAVVNISTSAQMRGFRRDPFWDQFEEFYGFPFGGQPRSSKPKQLALGTGFVIREDGLIVTNAHVIRQAEVITVQFDEKSDKTYEAKLIGADDRSDIALLKIQPQGKLTVATLGSSSTVEVGEWVAAFGNPFGHGHTVTKGIISSIGRSLEEINRFPLLQTDTAINPGNSGGPLVNSRGQVIGVNSAIDARAQGIGFAIPIDEVKRILPELENRGGLRKGYLGLGLADVISYADEEASGAGVIEVEQGGPADKAGIQYGDVIIEYNGKKIKNRTELIDAVADTTPGVKVDVKVLRQVGNRTRTLSLPIVLAERKDGNIRIGKAGQKNQTESAGEKTPHGLGFSVSDSNKDLRELYKLPKDAQRPVITNVENGTTASFVGLQEGDLILEVNKNEVRTAKDVIKHLQAKENTLRIARGSRIIIISMVK